MSLFYTKILGTHMLRCLRNVFVLHQSPNVFVLHQVVMSLFYTKTLGTHVTMFIPLQMKSRARFN